MSDYSVTASAELMENYLQADVLRPQKKFTALQTDAGSAMLFSINTADHLVVTKETPESRWGWEADDLSSVVIGSQFPTGATCTEFAAAQEAAKEDAAATIRLAMVVNDGTDDHLFVSLGNSDSDTSWTKHPQWTACPFDARDSAGHSLPVPSPLQIVGLMISEAVNGEFIAVDIVRNPGSPAKMVSRYHLDLSEPSNPKWVPSELPIDLEVDGYSSCLGRSKGAYGVDGIYTGGKLGGSAQLIYTPLWNAFEPKVPPDSAALKIPGGAAPEALAAVRNPDDTSDLYVVAGEGLYYFAASNQRNGATGELLLSDPLLRGIRSFFASGEEGVTVWGLNGDDEVFYLTWPVGEPPGPGHRPPAVILAGTDAISPFIDRQYSANTFFAHSGEGLMKAVKSPATGIWSKQRITLPPAETAQEAIAFSSYTTRLQVTDGQGLAAPEVPVTLTAVGVTGVYIAHQYYVIGPVPTEVKTDQRGSITIVEAVKALTATRFTATVSGGELAVNPMSAPFERSAKLDTVSALEGAVITDKQGKARAFVPGGTGQKELEGVAASNKQLAVAYEGLVDKPLASLAGRPSWMLRPEALTSTATDFVAANIGGDSILSDLGDLFSWLESGIDAVVSVIKDAAEDVWYFVAEIAGQVYHGILDCVETVVAAVTWVYDQIKIAVEDVIKFLEFLFAWPDILITHRVMKNILTQFAGEAIDNLGAIKQKLAKTFEELRGDIDTWADIPSFGQTSDGVRGENAPLPAQNSAPANLGIHHFEGNVSGGTTAYAPPDPGEEIFADLLRLVENEGSTLVGAVEAIRTDVIDKFGTLTITEVAEKLVAILADTLLETTENVLEATLDVLIALTEGMLKLLTASIDIPVLSTLYRMISGDDLSILDALCLIAAIPATLIYKGIAGAAPFPRGDAFTEGLLAASSFAEVRSQFYGGGAVLLAAGVGGEPVLDEAKLKVFGVVSGVFAFFGSIALAIVSTIQKSLEAIGLEAAYPKMLAAVGAVANIAYVSPNLASAINAKTDSWYADLNAGLMYVSVLKGIAAIPLATTERLWVKRMFPAVETTINVVWNVPVIMNIIVNKDKWNTTYKALIPESIGNFAFNLGGMMEFPIYATEDLEWKAGMILIQDGLMVVYGSLMVVAGGIAAAE